MGSQDAFPKGVERKTYMFQQWKDLQLHKKKGFVALLFVELVVLVVLTTCLFGKRATYSFPIENGAIGLSGITLPKGTYQVQLHYVTDMDGASLCSITDTTIGFRHLFTNGEVLYSGKNSTDFEMWLLRDTTGMEMQVSYNGGYLELQQIDFVRNNGLQRIELFLAFMLFLFVDVAAVFRSYDQAYEVKKSTKTVIFSLFAIWVASSLPLFTDYILSSGDVGYHLMRIEGLKDGILSGQFPVRIAPKWLQDYGYADAIFYGQTMLLPCALLRMIGFTVTTSYRLFIMLINLLTAVIAYFCFEKMFKDYRIGILCSMLSTLSVYRLYKMYLRGSLGESFGLMFLPLIAYGFYKVFTMDIKDKNYRFSYLPLLIGFTGIIQSHMLTCEIVGGFTVLLCIILWKKVFRKETFLALAKTVIISTLFTLWFLVPFFDYMLTGDFSIQHAYERTIQERGLYLAHLLMPFPNVGGGVFPAETGLKDAVPVGIGFVLIVVLFVWGYLLFLGSKRMTTPGYLEKKEVALGKICAGFALLSMVMSLAIFPWNSIQFLHRITATLVSSLQFPERILMIAALCGVIIAGILGQYFFHREEKAWGYTFAGALVGLTLLSGMFLLGDFLFETGYVKIYNAAGMGYGYIAGEEYLPYGTDAGTLLYASPVATEGTVLSEVKKGALKYTMEVNNQEATEGVVTLPLLYYKGYETKVLASGEQLATYPGENDKVAVKIPANFSGTLETSFVSPIYWRLAEIISVLSFFAFVGCYVSFGRKKTERVSKS